jgi:zinc and cadmium transporter
MITQWFLAIASVTFVSLLSLIGIAFISVNEEKLRRIIFVMVSLAVGALFGDAFIHLLPESFERSQSSVKTSLYVLTGMLAFFVLEKFLLWKHQHVLESRQTGYIILLTE